MYLLYRRPLCRLCLQFHNLFRQKLCYCFAFILINFTAKCVAGNFFIGLSPLIMLLMVSITALSSFYLWYILLGFFDSSALKHGKACSCRIKHLNIIIVIAEYNSFVFFLCRDLSITHFNAGAFVLLHYLKNGAVIPRQSSI